MSVNTVIGDQDIEAFRRDGAVCLRGVFEAYWLDGVAEGIELAKAAKGPLYRDRTGDTGGQFFADFQLWQRFDGCKRFVEASPAAEIMAQLLGANEITYYHDHLLVKEPRTGAPTPWHHDQPYYPIDGAMVGSIWLPLDPVGQDYSLRIIAGSHRWGRWFRPQYFDAAKTTLDGDDDRFEDIPDFNANLDDYEILNWAVEPGDAIAFHALTVHSAPGNLSPARRRAWSTRWLGEDARYAERAGQVSPPLEGHGLKPGDAMTCAMFPLIWRA